MRDLPLAALRAFAAVYETGGVRPAARLLRITHSSISRHVRQLEAWLDVALLEPHSGKGRMVFTPHGEALGKAALSGLTELARAVDSVRELRRANSVVITTTASFAVRWLMPRLPSLHESQSWIDVSVITRQAVLDLSDQGADLALRMGTGPWPDGDGEPLMDDALYPVACPRYWNGLNERDASTALAKARLLHDRDPATAWEKWFAVHSSPEIDLRAGPRFTSSDLVIRAAALGLGVALARDRLVADEIRSGSLFRPFGKYQLDLPSAYWLIRPREQRLRPAVAAVVQWLKSQAERHALPAGTISSPDS